MRSSNCRSTPAADPIDRDVRANPSAGLPEQARPVIRDPVLSVVSRCGAQDSGQYACFGFADGEAVMLESELAPGDLLAWTLSVFAASEMGIDKV